MIAAIVVLFALLIAAILVGAYAVEQITKDTQAAAKEARDAITKLEAGLKNAQDGIQVLGVSLSDIQARMRPQ